MEITNSVPVSWRISSLCINFVHVPCACRPWWVRHGIFLWPQPPPRRPISSKYQTGVTGLVSIDIFATIPGCFRSESEALLYVACGEPVFVSVLPSVWVLFYEGATRCTRATLNGQAVFGRAGTQSCSVCLAVDRHHSPATTPARPVVSDTNQFHVNPPSKRSFCHRFSDPTCGEPPTDACPPIRHGDPRSPVLSLSMPWLMPWPDHVGAAPTDTEPWTVAKNAAANRRSCDLLAPSLVDASSPETK